MVLRLASLATSALLLLAACHGHGHTKVVVSPAPRHVWLTVEVYDPVTNYVWEGVSVRIVEGEMEWSGCICRNPDPDDWRLTDDRGIVEYSPADLADAGIGFMEDASGLAILTPHPDEDEAYVQLELAAKGFENLLVDVKLTWDEPDVFVSVPFEPLHGESSADGPVAGVTRAVALRVVAHPLAERVFAGEGGGGDR